MGELLQVEGVGPQVAGSIREFCQNPKNRDLLQKLLASGLHLQSPEEPQATPLAGKTFVFTGGLQHFSRKRLSRW